MKQKKIISCMMNTAVSSIMDSITGYATNRLTNKFAPNFFKKVFINDSLTSVELGGNNERCY